MISARLSPVLPEDVLWTVQYMPTVARKNGCSDLLQAPRSVRSHVEWKPSPSVPTPKAVVSSVTARHPRMPQRQTSILVPRRERLTGALRCLSGILR